MKSPDQFKYDVRVRERALKSGMLEKKDMDARIAALPDLEGDSVIVEIQQPALAPDEAPVEPATPEPAAAPVRAEPVAEPVAAAPAVVEAPAAEPPQPAASATPAPEASDEVSDDDWGADS